MLDEKGLLRVREFGGRAVFASDSLNQFLSLGRLAWKQTRDRLQQLLNAENAELRDDAALREQAFHRQSDVTMQLPARIGDYTISIHPITTRTTSARCCVAPRTR
jgi:fumarylacetoacetase